MCCHECISHTATDDQCIYFIKKVVDNGDLRRNLSTTKNCYEWSFRIVYSISKEINFFLHQITDNTVTVNELSNTNVRTMCSMSRTKCIIYKYIAKRSKFFREGFTILCLFCSVTCVFKKDHVAILHCCNGCFCILADNVSVCCKFYFLT